MQRWKITILVVIVVIILAVIALFSMGLAINPSSAVIGGSIHAT